MEARFRRSVRPGVLALLAAMGSGAHCLGASAEAVAVVRFQATVRASTSLSVSSRVLAVAPQPESDTTQALVGVIDFRAAARTTREGEVLLTVEPMVSVDSLGPEALPGVTAVDFQGQGEGTRAGTLRAGRPEAVARWSGPGLRSGRITFTVRGGVRAPGASVPVRFLLSAP
jgi:hypothetical protein